MKRIIATLYAVSLSVFVFAQNYSYYGGEELRIKKGTINLNVLAADKDGFYFTQERAGTSLFGGPAGHHNNVLVKLDKNFNEVYTKDYKNRLDDHDFHSFQLLGGDLYLFATDYIKKEKQFKVYWTKIDKTNGELTGALKELASYTLESKRDNFEMKITALKDGNLLMVNNVSGKDRTSLGVIVMDKNFKQQHNKIIHLTFDPGTYSLQDVKLAKDNTIVLLGKVFEEV